MGAYFVLDSQDAGTTIARSGSRTEILMDDAEGTAVRRAIASLIEDLKAVCGSQAGLVSSLTGAGLVVGTIGVSTAIDEAIRAGALDVAQLRLPDGSLRWEGYVLQTIDDALYVVGADARGTVFGIHELSEAIGVSPWAWFADVPVQTRAHVTVRRDTYLCDWPSVQYRGIFINDEEQLAAWARTHTSDGTIGPQLYARVFELLLRLKANYIWPAMHVNAFNANPECGRLANAMGVVVGTSHCDMLLRSNEHEFGPWALQQAQPVAYDYSIPGENREALHRYWRESIQQNAEFEVSWTVGMRGIHDYGFRTDAIDADDGLTDASKHHARVDLLSQVIADQRELLRDTLGPRADDALQIFIPYKEVLPLYDDGLDVPQDVTIVWANDNFGYVRRFPSGSELSRQGGHGLYYHSSYWSRPPRSYLAGSSTSLRLMRNELTKSWRHGIRKLWVDNVGSLKPLELETEYFLRCAWATGKVQDPTTDLRRFVADWADRTFSNGIGKRVARILERYYEINGQRKFEHLTAGAFPQTGYGDEASRRLAALEQLFEEATALLDVVPDIERDAFLQLVLLKVNMAYFVFAEFVYADRSVLANKQGRAVAADAHLARSRQFEAARRAFVHHYNSAMSGGKWRDMYTPEKFPPPVMAMYPAAAPALRIGASSALGISLWGEEVPGPNAGLTFSAYDTTDKWIDLFPTGACSVEFTLTSDDWIELSTSHGVVRTEARVAVRVPDAVSNAGRTGTVHIAGDDGSQFAVQVHVAQDADVDPAFSGTVEADGYISIDAGAPDESCVGEATSWSLQPALGREGNTAAEALTDRASSARSGSATATLEYRFHLVTPGVHTLELHRVPTLNSTGDIRVGVSVDDHPQVVVSSPTTDEYRGAWTQTVLDNIERLVIHLPHLETGTHTVRLHAIDEHFAVSKLVIYTTEPKPTNLGPLFSHHTDRPEARTADPDPSAYDPAALDAAIRATYDLGLADVPLPDVVYVGADFWSSDTTFKRNTCTAQPRLDEPLYTSNGDGTKDVLAAMGRGPLREHRGVIAFDAARALADDATAWRTRSVDTLNLRWTHTQSETHGRTGLAMHVENGPHQWSNPLDAPGLHYELDVQTGGLYNVWLLVKYDSHDDDACFLALDGNVQSPELQYSGGSLYSFGTQQIWNWNLVSQLKITPGRHVFSVIARKAGLRIDRLYLTTGEELPPVDAAWDPSARLRLSTLRS